MLFEILSTGSMLGVWGASYYFQTNQNKDSDKILKIAENCGLYTKEEKLRLYRRRYDKKRKCTEYVFKIPLGLELEDFMNKYGKFKDGLNNSSARKLILKDLKNIKWNEDLLKQFQKWVNHREKLNKEIEFEYDGMLKVKVYEEGLKEQYDLTQEIMKKCKPWNVPLGITQGEEVFHNFEKGNHALIGGATDTGKSNIQNLIITCLLHNHPNEVKFTLIDLKGGLEFGTYEHLKQTKNFASNIDEALIALENAQSEMESMFQKLRRSGKKNVKQLGIKERHFVIIDEAAELASDGEQDKSIKEIKVKCENIIKDIARRGRASGFKLLYCTQYPTTETVSSQVKRNLITRICFTTDTSTASTVVLDEKGAEKLGGIQGRAIYKPNINKKTIQTYYVSEDLIQTIIQPHINFKARSETSVSHTPKKEEKGGKYTTIIEKA